MNKNMYSLMLSEEIVNEIDSLAYKNGTNRSNMINTILADYVNFRTPEMRLNDIFTIMEKKFRLSESVQVVRRNSNTVLCLRSHLQFKYNPTMKYNVELYKTSQDIIGELKASLRTQNSALLLCLMQFFKLWVRIEDKYLSGSEYNISDGKFVKKFMLRGKKNSEQYTDEELSRSLSEYVVCFDNALKAYFYNSATPSKAMIEVESIYVEYFSSSELRF